MVSIVRRSAAVVTFVALLSLTLSVPQLRHVERLADMLVMAPRKKTLAQLVAQELDGVDASNLADFFRISPWDADDLRLPLVEALLRDLARRVTDPSLPIYLTLDDSLAVKDKGTRKLQSVDWQFDHNRKQVVKAGNHVVLGIHWGVSTAGVRTTGCVIKASWNWRDKCWSKSLGNSPQGNRSMCCSIRGIRPPSW